MVWWKPSFCTRPTPVSDFLQSEWVPPCGDPVPPSSLEDRVSGWGAGGHLPFQATLSLGRISCPRQPLPHSLGSCSGTCVLRRDPVAV